MLAFVLACCLAQSPEVAATEPGEKDPPKGLREAAKSPEILRQPNGDFLVSKMAFTLIDDELRRLQRLEREHKAEKWWPGVAISATVGFLLALIPCLAWVSFHYSTAH